MDTRFADYIETLPARQTAERPWRRTKRTPCPLLSQCTVCNQYLPIDNFYVYGTKNGRRDAFGNYRSYRCDSCQNNDYVKLDAKTKLIYTARNHARIKNMECTITVDDFDIPTHCPVLGIPLVPKVGQGRQNRHQIADSPTIDRVDNSKGYIPGNICVISGRANHLKSNATIEEVEAVLKYMKDHRDATTSPAEVLR